MSYKLPLLDSTRTVWPSQYGSEPFERWDGRQDHELTSRLSEPTHRPTTLLLGAQTIPPGVGLMTERNYVPEAIEGRSAGLFFVAGGLLVVFASLLGLQALTSTVAPEDVFGPSGFAIAFVGLIGLYPVVVEETPWSARAGAFCAVVGAVGAAVTAGGSLGAVLGVLPEEPPAWVGAFMIAMVVGMVPGFVAFAAATLRTSVYPRRLGLLLLAPPVIFVVMLSGTLHAVVNDALANFFLGSGQALSHLAIGVTLRARGITGDRRETAGEPAA